MQLGFDTNSVEHGQAALILYAMYRSRDKSSPLNGLETWNRFTSFIKGAALKSTTTAEFCTNFCHMAKIGSIKPCFLSTGNGLMQLPDGSIVQSDSIKDYKLGIIEENSLLKIFERESQYLVMLVRERIQRDKMNGIQEENHENQD